MPNYVKVMVGFAVMLILLGLVAWLGVLVRDGWEAAQRGVTAIAVPAIAAGLMLVMAWLSNQPPGLAKSFGIHAGFIVSLLIGIAFSIVAYRRWMAEEPPVWAASFITTMAALGFVTFAVLLAMRPKPADRKPRAGE